MEYRGKTKRMSKSKEENRKKKQTMPNPFIPNTHFINPQKYQNNFVKLREKLKIENINTYDD